MPSLRKRTMLKSHAKSLNEGPTSSSSSDVSQSKSNRALRSSHTTFTEGMKHSQPKLSTRSKRVHSRKANDLSLLTSEGENVVSDEYHGDEDDISLTSEVEKAAESRILSSTTTNIPKGIYLNDVEKQLIVKGKPSLELCDINKFRNQLLTDTKENLVDIALRFHDMCQESQIKYKNLHDQMKDHRLNDFFRMKEEWKNKQHKQDEEIKKLIESSVFKLEEKVEKLESEKSDLLSKNKEMVEKMQQLSNNILELEKEKHDIEKEEKLESEKSDLLSKNEELLERIQQLSNDILELEKEKHDKEEKLESEKSDLLSKNEELLEKKEKLSNDILELEKEKHDAAENADKLESEKSDLLTKNKEMLEKIQQLSNENLKLWQMPEDEDTKMTASDVVCSLFPKSYEDAKCLLMKNSFLQWFKEDNIDIQKISLYEDVIINLQDVLDFYSLLTGISIWKSNCYNNNKDLTREDRKCSQYFCQLSCGGQKDIPYDGYRFVLDLDNDEKVIKYSPDPNVVLNCPLPKVLNNPASYTLDKSCMFLKGILVDV